MQVIPAILASNGSLPMDQVGVIIIIITIIRLVSLLKITNHDPGAFFQIGEAIGIQREPIASPFTK